MKPILLCSRLARLRLSLASELHESTIDLLPRHADRLGQLIILHAEHEARPTVCADLGHGVPDTAMLETTAYCPEVAEKEGAA